MCLGKASLGCVVLPMKRLPRLGVTVLFFGNVNQVLVRLWARVVKADPYGLCGGPVVWPTCLTGNCCSWLEWFLHSGGGWRPNGWMARVQRRDERSDQMDP